MRKDLFAFVLLGFFIIFLSTGAFAQNKTVVKYAIDVAQFSDTLRITLDALVGENDSIIILGAENKSSYAIYDTKIIEEFPKEIVANAGGISSAHEFAVLQEEPAIIEWEIPSLMPGEKIEFAYELKVRVDGNALKSISTYPKFGRGEKGALPNVLAALKINFTTAFASLPETEPQTAAAVVIAILGILLILAHIHNPKRKKRRK